VRAEPSGEGKFQWLARLGLAARGMLYILIAGLVLATGRTEGITGAMEYLDSGLGRVLLAAILVGLVGYGLWRLTDAAFGMDSGRHSSKAWRQRIVAAASGAIYLFLAYKAFRLLLGDIGGPDGEGNAAIAGGDSHGEIFLWAAAAVMAVAAVVQLFKAASCSFLRRLDERAREPWIRWLGRIGYAARGVIFGTVAYVFAHAGIDSSSAGAGGIEQALDVLASPVRYAVALGLMLFGAYGFVEARYRSVHKPPVKHIKRKLKESVAP
jgi:hypothetical protein